jgi:hypothetical protein
MIEKIFTNAFLRRGMTEKELAKVASDSDLLDRMIELARETMTASAVTHVSRKTDARSTSLRGYYDKAPEHHTVIENGVERTVAWSEVLKKDVGFIVLPVVGELSSTYMGLLNKLHHREIITIRDLLLCNKKTLLSIDQFGNKRLTYIENQLALQGLRLTEMSDIQDEDWINPFAESHRNEVGVDTLPYESFLNLSAPLVYGLQSVARKRFGALLEIKSVRKATIKATEQHLLKDEVTLLKSYLERRNFSVEVE